MVVDKVKSRVVVVTLPAASLASTEIRFTPSAPNKATCSAVKVTLQRPSGATSAGTESTGVVAVVEAKRLIETFTLGSVLPDNASPASFSAALTISSEAIAAIDKLGACVSSVKLNAVPGALTLPAASVAIA